MLRIDKHVNNLFLNKDYSLKVKTLTIKLLLNTYLFKFNFIRKEF